MALTWTPLSYGRYSATGTAGNDVVTLATEGDVLTNGNVLYLMGGNDYAMLDFGNDLGMGGTGNDTIYGRWGDDLLAGEEGNDILYGEDDNDTLYGGTGMDAMYGGAGNDKIDTEVADNESDNLAGGNGHDLYIVRDIYDVISSEASFATSTSRDVVELYASSYNLNVSADSQAIETLIVKTATGAAVKGSMNANTITGFTGNDSINGDAGNDIIRGGDGVDSLAGSIGDDTLYGEKHSDQIKGDSGLDKIYGGEGQDSIWGGDQADTIFGGDAQDSIYGGSGNDTIYGDDSNTNTADYIEGGSGDDIIFGGAGPDKIYGGAGNDRIYAEAGSYESMYGGAGNDTYYLTEQLQYVKEVAGEGYDTVYTAFTKATMGYHTGIEALMYKGAKVAVAFDGDGANNVLSIYGAASGTVWGRGGADDMMGSDGTDLLYGGDGNDIIQGLGGNDSLYGEAGNDQMYGGLGNDSYFGVTKDDIIIEQSGGGTDTVHAFSATAGGTYTLSANIENGQAVGDYLKLLQGNALGNTLNASGYSNATLRGLDGDDKLIGKDNADILEGGNGYDTLTGNAGNDTLNGGSAADLMQGGAGNDTYHVDNLADQVVEGIFANGIDTVRASTGGWTLAVDVENLIYTGSGTFMGTGSSANNRIEGGTGSDTLKGMAGNDVLVSKGGSDQMYGGTGADQFIFSNDNGFKNNARIHDFEGGVDKIVLDADAGWTASYVDADTTKFTSATGGTVIVDGLDIGHVWNSLTIV